ncbi:carbapenem self-resistance protein CarG family protein [Sodalis sp. RH21]|uniref:carbapenem self-resistance protein CarG family protein n=1 Tax=unclassified Sodalis (in: enterobacteria) TaxID=2636512 RepID=UPI0039B6E30B
MRVNYLLGLLLFSACPQAASLSPVPLKPGPNLLDLNHDGRADYIMLAQFDNNTSHPSSGISFFIAKPDGGYSVVPVAGGEGFIWFDYRLSASALRIHGYRLYRDGVHYYLIGAHKTGEDLTDPQPVLFDVYQLEETRDDPGVPLYGWQLRHTFTSSRHYQSVDRAFVEIDNMSLPR